MVRKLTIAYRGLAYSGWQRQDNAVTVQEVLEDAIAQLAGERLVVVGASRTDAGVHARGQVAHLEGAERLPDRALVFGVNRLLPDDVRVLAALTVANDFHARKHARSKLYSYRLVRAEVLSPLESPYAVQVDPRIDVARMNRACSHIVGEHDFTAFALAGGSHRSPRRTIFEARFDEEGDAIVFRVTGSGFLRGMVRALVGTLLEVGLDRRTAEDVGQLADGAPRAAAGPTAPARGLVLESISYSPAVQESAAPVVD